MPKRKTVWIGLVGVRPRPGNDLLSDAKGAYVNALALANSRSEYISIVREELGSMNFDVFEVEAPEPLSRRLKSHSVDDELRQLAEEVGRTRSARFGTFHSFRTEDE
jgi:hypothetical protein